MASSSLTSAQFDPDPNVLAPNVNRSYPVYAPKRNSMGATFAIPEIRNARVAPSHIALGIRPQALLIPRPLHDPFADLAIVLYDPTIDERETDEERQARLKEEERERERKEAEDKTAGMWNPHKSLRTMLGEDKKKDKARAKVPVVIDPVLSKVLRPHQVEGVKVRINNSRLRSSRLPAVLVQVHERDDARESIRVTRPRWL